MMKALRLFGPRDLRLLEEPVPKPMPGQALLRVRAVTVCHSDIHYYKYARIGDTVSKTPLVLGHEFCGEVIETTPGVEGLYRGDLVAVEPAISCGRCRYCREGNPNLCEHLLFSGTPPLDGALREYMPYGAEFLFPLPAGFTPEEGALLEPLGVAIHGWDLAKLRIGESVAIVGCGPIGLLLIQLARIGGAAQIMAIEPLDYRRDLAVELGAIGLAPDDDLERRVLALTGGHGVDVAVEVAGTLPAQEEAVRVVKRGGTVVAIGIPPEDKLVMTHHVIRRKGLTIKLARRMKLTYPRAISVVQRGLVDLKPLVTHRFALDEADRAFRLVEQYADGVIKAVIYP
ncbi:MAG: alcohol dehydrogenase catalytic domain-containing protein [Chloroflexi bacterium]|nr:alcohol dehydrogenase catalytic domain-containing protein [Chloroflexota bacterium]